MVFRSEQTQILTDNRASLQAATSVMHPFSFVRHIPKGTGSTNLIVNRYSHTRMKSREEFNGKTKKGPGRTLFWEWIEDIYSPLSFSPHARGR